MNLLQKDLLQKVNLLQKDEFASKSEILEHYQ